MRTVFILPTGSTPLPMYNEIISDWEKGLLDLSNTITFNMDEYVGLDKKNSQSYHFYMDKNFFFSRLPAINGREID